MHLHRVSPFRVTSTSFHLPLPFTTPSAFSSTHLPSSAHSCSSPGDTRAHSPPGNPKPLDGQNLPQNDKQGERGGVGVRSTLLNANLDHSLLPTRPMW
ncbi:hypothetical protein E2C01_094393 [Portunus trituberculatus]|uniref:Uncharacterized protein n=1 Tax=Portunus trituberculatus TaxID=210409 RepID=A0A5B7JM09_PORTR|nr:hypothetical protein [Portunus trituberculatus]